MGVFSLSFSARPSEADPVDDFRMNLGKPTGRHAEDLSGGSFRLIPEQTVIRILADRMVGIPKADAPRFAKHLIDLCKTHRFDPAFVLSLIDVESHFRAGVVSPAGAVGLMQVMAPTAHFVLTKLAAEKGLPFAEVDLETQKRLRNIRLQKLAPLLKEPYLNTAIGIAYLGWLRDYYEGMPPYYVLAAYNVGPAKMDELLSRKSFRPQETKKYYASILKRVHHFRFYDEPSARKIKRISSRGKSRVL
ncbi:MAG: transglycosylase SLT domain-containing protein [Bdellovibrio sp.]|nr:transglycosylase SLT domain-containing protein [Bdellovibrio sp.]